eukprot:COSAG02_NODE_1197_length_13932_cov_42.811176_5_plen_84_part_00
MASTTALPVLDIRRGSITQPLNFSCSAVSASVMGLRDIDEFKHVLSAISERDTLTATEKLEMEKHGAARLAATVAAEAEVPRL